MKIDELTKNYIESFIYLERYVNQRYYSRFCNDSEVSGCYTPKKGVNSFFLLSVAPEKTLTNNFNYKNSLFEIFFVHPDFPVKGAKKSNITAFPTASTRTVLIRDFNNQPFFVKLNLPKRISRFSRGLTSSSVDHSLKVALEVLEICKKNSEFGCLYEPAASCLRNFGCLFREFNASPRNRDRFLIPMFSLYSYDLRNPSDELLIKQLSEKNGLSVEEILRWILEKIVSFWFKSFLEKGLLLEMHGQNTLLEIDNSFNLKRVIVRDFTSTRIDKNIRNKNRLDINYRKKIIGKNSFFSRKKELSLVYDFLISHHFLSPLINVCSSKYNIDTGKLEEFVRNIFRKHLSGKNSLFPKCCYGYTDEFFINEKPRLKVFLKKPLLR